MLVMATVIGSTVSPASALSLSASIPQMSVVGIPAMVPVATTQPVNLTGNTKIAALSVVNSSNLTNVGAGKVDFSRGETIVDSFNGVPAYYAVGDHTTHAKYSCAKYVTRYYKEIYGVTVFNLLFERTPAVSEQGYSCKSINVRDAKPGDIGYHQNSKGNGGHWFIIKSVGANGVTVIEQNYKNAGDTSVGINREVSYNKSGFKVFRLYKDGKDMNDGGNNITTDLIEETQGEYLGEFILKTADGYGGNVQFASTVSGKAAFVVDNMNYENNEVYHVYKYGDYYRFSPKHAPHLAMNALYGKDAKAGQQVVFHTWAEGDDASLWSKETVNGGIRLRSKANPKLVVDVDRGQKTKVGAKINLWTADNTGNQTLVMEKVSGGAINTPVYNNDYSGTWAMMVNGTHCINIQFASTVVDQAKGVIDNWNGEANETWIITKIGNYYRISPKHAPHLALNAQFGAGAKAGQQVSLHIWRNNDDASLWSIEEINDGTGAVRIRNKANSKLVLDVDHGQKTTAGTRINLWTQDNTGNQNIYMKKL